MTGDRSHKQTPNVDCGDINK